jgi:signal transduction histidine kinase
MAICFHEGLFRLDPSGALRHWTPTNGLPNLGCRFVFEDRERNLWVGMGGGLTKAIEWMAEQLGETSTTRFSTDLDNIDDLLAPEMEMTLYRILQEGVRNVLRHAGASQLILEVKREETAVRASLFDSRCGFDMEKLPAQAGPGRGMGLLGMRERVSYLDGSLDIQSTPGRGTRVTVRIPLKLTPTKR